MHAAIIGLSGPALTDAEAAMLRALPPAGVILFARNIEAPAQLSALTASLRALVPELLLMVDQEGGRVARLRPPYWRAHPPAAALGALHARDPAAGLRAAWLTGALIGADCAAAGFDVACAPVLDLAVPGADSVVGDRAFAADPPTAAALGAQVAAGLLAAGVQPVMKHAPGHGRARCDSHLALPVVDAAADDLADDIAPFALNAGLPWAMTAHILYRALDPALPATLSRTVIGTVIRGLIGFEGVLVTDDLAMRALQGEPAELARAALAAGCDLALYCTGEYEPTSGLLRACPPVTEAAGGRMARARDLAARSRRIFDPEALDAERAALLAP